MSDRPELTTELKRKEFLEYYFLKEELVCFCRENGLPTSGGKAELTERIAYYLDTGKIKAIKTVRTQKPKITAITRDSIIESDLVCSEIHRAFFLARDRREFFFQCCFSKMA